MTRIKMGLQMGLEGDGRFCKRKFRWLFSIPDIVGELNSISALPPEKSQRPHISFQEMRVNHLIEDVYYPAKPEWKPISLTLYDVKRTERHPVFDWILEVYNPERGTFVAPNSKPGILEGLIRQCTLQLFDGCGNEVESWILEECWPQSVDFQTLDMSDPGIITCDLTLRYARAYIPNQLNLP